MATRIRFTVSVLLTVRVHSMARSFHLLGLVEVLVELLQVSGWGVKM